MGNIFSPTHLIIILLVILVLFGRGKVSELMGDIAKGIKAFKKNIKEEEESAEDKFEMSHTSKAINVESKHLIHNRQSMRLLTEKFLLLLKEVRRLLPKNSM
ncbi:twin arginine translocase protein A [Bartonella doshiae]|uniref:Sec-independent protein translocase protein TatA n=1 Tax=Bartonella doshiae TaxID=33044 RepID=A0A380ZN11_BARDO|nr:twin arginine translocase protein A [Bartonella doshiae]